MVSIRNILILVLAVALTGCFSSSSSSSSTSGPIEPDTEEGVSEEPTSVPRPTSLRNEPARTRLRSLKSRAIMGGVHSVYRYEGAYAVLNIQASHRISSSTLGTTRPETLADYRQEIRIVAEAICQEVGLSVGASRSADDTRNRTIETFFICSDKPNPKPSTKSTSDSKPTPPASSPNPEASAPDSKPATGQGLGPTSLPGEPAKTQISNFSSSVTAGGTHTLFSYSNPFSIMGVSATYRLSSQTGGKISTNAIRRLQAEALGIMTRVCTDRGLQLGRSKSTADNNAQRRENFFSCTAPTPAPQPAPPVTPELKVPGVILVERH